MTDTGDQLSSINATEMPVDAAWFSQDSRRIVFEQEVLPKYLASTRWYPERSPKNIHLEFTSAISFGEADGLPWLTIFETTARGVATRYVLPMQIEWEPSDQQQQSPKALATVHRAEVKGTLLDVATDHKFIALLLRNLHDSLIFKDNGLLRIEFKPTSKFADLYRGQPANIRAVRAEQSNSTALVDSDFVVKIYRKLEAGINPEIEMGRFLTEVAGFTNTPALLGSVELVEGDTQSAIAIVHAFIENQGDAWGATSADLDLFVERQRRLPSGEYTSWNAEQEASQWYITQIGKRVAEMHLALATSSHDSVFAPELIKPAYVSQWLKDASARAEHVFTALEQRRTSLNEGVRPLLERVLTQREVLDERLKTLLPLNSDGLKIRHHGDLHLGQILIVPDDIFIIDFEGEPRRPISERRRKAPAARDVAGVLRSIDYAHTAALQRALNKEPDHHGKVASGLKEWRVRSLAAFLSEYRKVTMNSPLWPTDPQAADRMLNFFLLEKVLYEIEYELAHRPDWLGVPLAGFLDILTISTEAS
jgi:maltose alpha-D-glucosyltransferase / alpha-amylase